MNPASSPYLDLLKLASPEAIVALTALVVLTLGLTISRARLACSIAAILGLVGAVLVLSQLPRHATLFDGMFVITPLASFFKGVVIVLALFTILLATGNPSQENYGEYLGLILFATIGLMLLVAGEDLLMIFIGLELTGLSLYLLAGFDKTDLLSAEGGLKYFLFGGTASAFTLFGLSFVYGAEHSTNLSAIAANLGNAAPVSPLLMAGLIMTLVGLGFKIAAAPFHLWAPDAYQGAPIPSAAFIASASKVASFVILGRILLAGFAPLQGAADWHHFAAGWAPVIAALSALSILIGNFVALAQKNVRRLLAYSAVAHAGYALLGLVAGGKDGFGATLFYVTIYAATLVGAFGVVGLVRSRTGGDDITNFAGLRARSPLLATCMAIFFLSLAGLPPLGGFFGKFYLFAATIRGGQNHGLLWLVVLGLFGSLVSLYYYLIVLKAVFLDEPAQSTPQATVAELFPKISIAVLAAVVFVVGLSPALLLGQIVGRLP